MPEKPLYQCNFYALREALKKAPLENCGVRHISKKLVSVIDRYELLIVFLDCTASDLPPDSLLAFHHKASVKPV